ncbi:hypothetical protein [Pelagibacterium luteolum]|uniref:Uncharacterized protein n=1 Tax=Pelagibacterium luteolum TaxID=440168 RepID=A0A1G7TMC9_9HYPH|nr:hypothetical protein [Pelagibacterium luteolum]SDG36478.1 hypothetical protein SAMN04487974_102225 [Pelagibacterium luteolum]
MTAQAKTIAVVGSTPFAWLLAGLLAADHSRAIVLVSAPHDSHRLSLPPSLSVAPITRPETWARLTEIAAPAARRLSRIAPRLARRTDVIFGARSPAARNALSHMRHLMAGFGHAVEPAHAIPDSSAIRVRDAWAFDGDAFKGAAAPWLAAANVAIVNSASGLKVRRDGSASFGATNFDLVVLADDQSIVDRLSAEDVAGFASMANAIGIHTSPVPPMSNAVTIDLDSGATMLRDTTGKLIATAYDEDEKGLDRIRASMPRTIAPRLAAKTRFKCLHTHDGAPVIGTPRRSRMFIIAGLGALDLVFAPMLARLIAGDASGVEAEWAAAHAADLRQPRVEVAEYVPGRLGDER